MRPRIRKLVRPGPGGARQSGAPLAPLAVLAEDFSILIWTPRRVTRPRASYYRSPVIRH